MNTLDQQMRLENELMLFKKQDLIFLTIVILLAGSIVKLPIIFNWDEEFFYPRNIGFIVFPFIMGFFSWKHNVSLTSRVIPLIILIGTAVYINLLPNNNKSDTLTLSCMHLPILVWSMVGYAYTGNKLKNLEKRLAFLRFSGDLTVMSAILALAGGLFTIITIGLYEMIGMDIKDFYVSYVVAWGVPAIPIVATLLVFNYPMLIGRVSPIIAKIFTPFVCLTLLIFLGVVIANGKDPFNDREFLVVFNLLLIAVMSIILFSISDISKEGKSRSQIFILIILSLLTLITNGIAFSAIVYRIVTYGFTPNRLAVMGSNLIMLFNLMGITYQLIRTMKGISTVNKAENVLAKFLPIYTLWCGFVIIFFPIIFAFK